MIADTQMVSTNPEPTGERFREVTLTGLARIIGGRMRGRDVLMRIMSNLCAFSLAFCN